MSLTCGTAGTRKLAQYRILKAACLGNDTLDELNTSENINVACACANATVVEQGVARHGLT